MRKLFLILLLICLPCYAVSITELQEQEKCITINNFSNFYIQLLEIKNTLDKPQINSLILLDNGYNNYSIEPNYVYLSKLPKNKIWEDYINLKLVEYKNINKNKKVPTDYHYEGITYNIEYIPKWLNKRINFLSKYPNFPLYKQLQQDNYYLIYDFIDDKNQVWNENNLNKNAQKAYKYFLKTADKNSMEYHIINGWYILLQKNNFKRTQNVIDFVNSYTDKYLHE